MYAQLLSFFLIFLLTIGVSVVVEADTKSDTKSDPAENNPSFAGNLTSCVVTLIADDPGLRDNASQVLSIYTGCLQQHYPKVQAADVTNLVTKLVAIGSNYSNQVLRDVIKYYKTIDSTQKLNFSCIQAVTAEQLFAVNTEKNYKAPANEKTELSTCFPTTLTSDQLTEVQNFINKRLKDEEDQTNAALNDFFNKDIQSNGSKGA